MFTADFKRIIRAGFQGFWRNGFVTAASVLVITITLFVVGSLIFFSALMNSAIEQLEQKVDVNVYFVSDAPEEDILGLKTELEGLPEIELVTYTSREEALEDFKERHKDDYLTLQALEELSENPLGASLNIQAKDASQYGIIAEFLSARNTMSGGTQIIDTINYYQNKEAITKLSRIIDGAETLGIAIVLLLAFIAIVITLNTIRLAIYTSREEISVMRLVGASKTYIQGPFMVEGIMNGVIATLIVLALFFPATYWFGENTERFFGGINIFSYYLANFWQVALIILITGLVLGAGSSYFAVRRYIKKKYLN